MFSLRELEGQLHKTVPVHSTEQDAKGQYVWRDDAGQIYYWSPTPTRYAMHHVNTVAEADGIMFLCPFCFLTNKGNIGTHGVMVSFAGRGVPDEAGSRGKDGPTRWEVSGTTIDDLVLTPSILLHGGCAWHGFVGSSSIPPGHAG